MALATDQVAETFLNVVAATPIDCPWPLFSENEVEVIYGKAAISATLNTDFTVVLDDSDFDEFTITPTAALIAKINALIVIDPTEINYITVRRVLPLTTSVTSEIVRNVTFLSTEVERLWMADQQVAETLARSLQFPVSEVGSPSVNVLLPKVDFRANKAVIFDSDGGITVSEDDYNDQAADAAASAAAALADRLLADADATATAADRVQTGLDRIATGQDAISAANSAAASASSAAQGLYKNVVTISHANSPYVPSAAQNGTLFRVDTSGGNVVINFSTLATYGLDMDFAFSKITTDTNTITVNAAGTDTIEGVGAFAFSDQYTVYLFIGDKVSGTWLPDIHSAAVADNSITTVKLVDGAVTTAKLDDGVVSGLTAVTIASNDYVMLADTSDSSKKKKGLVSSILSLLTNFVGDTGSGGTAGLVPAPAVGDAAAGKVLKADGTWASGRLSVQAASGVNLFNTVYHATSDLLVVVYAGYSGSYGHVQFLTDSTATPTTLIGQFGADNVGANNWYFTSTFPVKKGDYWEVKVISGLTAGYITTYALGV